MIEPSLGGTKNMDSERLVSLGKMTVFYVPSNKLDDPQFFAGLKTARNEIHNFLMQRFQAYTHTPTPVKGYWVDQSGLLVHDVLERYEVSFNSEEEFETIIDFLIEMCQTLDEASIYTTRGDRSYLVLRKA